MSEVSPQLVKQLREQTGAGMMDCKRALAEVGGDMDKAIEALRKKGLKDVSKRSGKVAAEGVIGVYQHAGNQVVAIVELNSETDFVARNEKFLATARDLAMQIAAMRPEYIAETDVPAALLEKEKEILLAQLAPDQKAKADKIIEGRLNKFFDEKVLLRQPFIKDDSGKLRVKDLLDELSIQMGEKIGIRRMQRFEVGEGVEKQETDFAAEVASMASGN